MRFQRESLREASSDILKISTEHYLEVSALQDLSLSVFLDRYHLLEQAGILFIFTARADEKLCGYANFVVGNHSHYQENMVAHCDSIFIQKSFRGHGMSFIRFCDEQLKDAGVLMVNHTVTPRRDFSPVLKKIGYAFLETIYQRRL